MCAQFSFHLQSKFGFETFSQGGNRIKIYKPDMKQTDRLFWREKTVFKTVEAYNWNLIVPYNRVNNNV